MRTNPPDSFPPRAPSSGEGESAAPRGLPVAALGLAYFGVLGAWLTLIGDPGARRWCRTLPALLAAVGSVGSAVFLVVMFRGESPVCWMCLVVHVVNYALTALLLSSWLVTSDVPADAVTPSSRVVAGALVVVVLVPTSVWLVVRAARLQAENAALRAEADLAEVDLDVLQWLHERTEPSENPIGPDATRYPSRQRGARVVVFTDLQCPYFDRFERMLLREIVPLFRGRLEVVFKHYPLCPDCNAGVARNVHPGACVAARIAEAARREGGASWPS